MDTTDIAADTGSNTLQSSGIASESSGLPMEGIDAHFSQLKDRKFAVWEEVELELHISGPYTPGSCVTELCLADSLKQLTVIPFDKWVQDAESDTFTIFVAHDDKLKQGCEYVARFLHEGAVMAVSDAFSFEGDSGDEMLFALGAKELRDLCAYRRHYRGYQAKLSQAEKHLQDERREWAKERELNQLNEALVWELKQGIAAKTADCMKALSEEKRRYHQELEAKDTALTCAKKMLDTSAKNYCAVKAEHDKLIVDYRLQQEALENVREQLSAQETTKALLRNEIERLKYQIADMTKEAKSRAKENANLKLAVKLMSEKPAVVDACVGTAEDGETLDNEVNSNVLLTGSAARELEDKVKEMMGRLSAAADEYAKLYRKSAKQERLLTLCQCVGKDGDCTAGVSSSYPYGGSPFRLTVINPDLLAPRKISSSVPEISELKGAPPQMRMPPLVDLSSCLSGIQNLTCQECPPTAVSTTDASCRGGARPKTAARDDAIAAPTCVKSRKVTTLAWKKVRPSPLARSHRFVPQNRQGWSLVNAPPPKGFGGPVGMKGTAAKDVAAQTDGAATTDAAAQVEATVPAAAPDPAEIQSEAETAELDSDFVAIEMPEQHGEPTPTAAPEPVAVPKARPTVCFLCLEEVEDWEDHMREEHRQVSCPVCGCLFDASLPSAYLENHVEDHFTPRFLD